MLEREQAGEAYNNRPDTGSAAETGPADALRRELAQQCGEIPGEDQNRAQSFPEALRGALANIRSERKYHGELIDFQETFAHKVQKLTNPAELELALIPLSHLGANQAFIPFFNAGEQLEHAMRFLQDELGLTHSAASQVLKPKNFIGRTKPEEQIVALTPTANTSDWLQQFIGQNCNTPGATVTLALYRNNSTTQIGLVISLESPRDTVNGLTTQDTMTQKFGLSSITRGNKALGPLIGVAENISEIAQRLYLIPTAERKQLATLNDNFLPMMHLFVTGMGSAVPSLLQWLVTGDLPVSAWSTYCLTVVATNVTSFVFEKGLARYQEQTKKQERLEKRD